MLTWKGSDKGGQVYRCYIAIRPIFLADGSNGVEVFSGRKRHDWLSDFFNKPENFFCDDGASPLLDYCGTCRLEDQKDIQGQKRELEDLISRAFLSVVPGSPMAV